MKNINSDTPLSKNQKKAHKLNVYRLQKGGDTWIRTRDTRIFSPMLYRLSYITNKSGCEDIKLSNFCQLFLKKNENKF